MSAAASPNVRNELMSKIKIAGTGPEIIVRKLLHKSGLRFRVNKKDMPGKPDIVLTRSKVIIFVHGCFWHQHTGCKKSSLPKTNCDFWISKLGENVNRDQRNKKLLILQGWKVVEIWECETKNLTTINERIKEIKELTEIG